MADKIAESFGKTRKELMDRMLGLSAEASKLKGIDPETAKALKEGYDKKANANVGNAVKKLPLSTLIDLYSSLYEAFAKLSNKLQKEKAEKIKTVKQQREENAKQLEALFMTYGEGIIDMEQELLRAGMNMEQRVDQVRFLEKFKRYEEFKENAEKNKAEMSLATRIRNWHELPDDVKAKKLEEIGYTPDNTIINRINETIAENVAKDVGDSEQIREATSEFTAYCSKNARTPRCSSKDSPTM